MTAQKVIKIVAFWLIGFLLIASQQSYAQTAVLTLELSFDKEEADLGDVLYASGTLTYNTGPAILDEVTINYYVGTDLDNVQPTFTHQLTNIEFAPGQTIAYNHEIEVADEFFTPDANNIIIVWPTTGLANDDNEPVRGDVWVNDNSTDLAVELVSFDGDYNDSQVRLNWMVASEGANSDFFDIERSLDGINYESCGRVEGWDFKAVEGVYEYEDNNPFFLKTYYRLQMTGTSGSSEYSETLIVERPEHNTLSIDKLYVNRVGQQLHLVFSASDNDPLTFVIYDTKGALIYTEKMTNVQVGFNEKVINTYTITSGLHVLTLQNGGTEIVSEKFFKY